ncbi:hypothetical protein [Pontibacter harenae]|uniref:hypothetical protein n=1 Tax=Pontibacter harenae TaxID=2894083 RepID=UPI001E3298EB|nr:hypothetical protein [Pontibacter harenae]MCC9169113.1 hypothetical protein [Pontibacter harenae]
MKTGKSLEEAILRAQQSTENNLQTQEQLNAMKTQENNFNQQFNSGQAPLNESHSNLLQSWHNLRGMECELDKRKLDNSSKGSRMERDKN